MIGVSASVPPCLSIREVPLVEMTAPAVCSCPEGQSRGALRSCSVLSPARLLCWGYYLPLAVTAPFLVMGIELWSLGSRTFSNSAGGL